MNNTTDQTRTRTNLERIKALPIGECLYQASLIKSVTRVTHVNLSDGGTGITYEVYRRHNGGWNNDCVTFERAESFLNEWKLFDTADEAREQSEKDKAGKSAMYLHTLKYGCE